MRFRILQLLSVAMLVCLGRVAFADDAANLQQDQLRKGETYLRAGNAIASVAPLLNVLRSQRGLDTDEAKRARLKLAEAYIDLGLYGSAEALAESLVGEGPPWRRQAQHVLIRVAIRKGDMAAMTTALNDYRKGVTGDVDSEVLFEAAKAAFSMRVTDPAAIAVFESFGDDDSLEALYFSGIAALLKQDYASAYTRFDRLAKQLDRDADPALFDRTQLALGRLYFEAGKANSAERFYAAIPEDSGVYDEALYETAWVYLSQGDVPAAAGNLLALAIEHPFSKLVPRAQVLYGYLLLKQGRFQEAERAFAAYIGHYSAISERIAELRSEHDPRVAYEELFSQLDQSIASEDHLAIELVNWLKQNAELNRSIELVKRLQRTEAELANLTQTLRTVQTLAEAGADAFPNLPGEPAHKVSLENRRQELSEAQERLEETVLPSGERLNGGTARTFGRIQRELQEATKMRTGLERMLEQVDEKRRELVSLLRYADTGTWEIWGEDGKLAPSTATAPATVKAGALEGMFRKLDATERRLFRALRTTAELEGRAIMTRFDALETQVPAKVLEELRADAIQMIEYRREWIREWEGLRRTRRETARQVRGNIHEILNAVHDYRSRLLELSRTAVTLRGRVAKTELALIQSSIGELLVHARLGNADVAWDARDDARERARQVRLQRKEELAKLRNLYNELGNTPIPLRAPAPEAVTSSTMQKADQLARRADTYATGLSEVKKVLMRQKEASKNLMQRLVEEGHREDRVARLESAGLLIAQPDGGVDLQFAGGAVFLDGRSIQPDKAKGFILDSYLEPGTHELDAALIFVDGQGEPVRMSGTFHFTLNRAKGYQLSLRPEMTREGRILSFQLIPEGSND